MQKNSLQDIEKFVSCRQLAVAGVSRKKQSFSASVIEHLKSKDYTVYSINPNFDENDADLKEFKSVADLPEDVHHLLVLTNPSQTLSVVKSAFDRGINNIWVQQKSETPEVVEFCNTNNINVILHQCIFMFTQPVGMHKFHYRLKKFFGGLPANRN